MIIDKDDDRYEPSTTRSSFRPEQGRKYLDEFTYYTDKALKFDVDGYVDSLMKAIDKEVERKLSEMGYIKVRYCKQCWRWKRKGLSIDGDCTFGRFPTEETFYCGAGETEEQRCKRMKKHEID